MPHARKQKGLGIGNKSRAIEEEDQSTIFCNPSNPNSQLAHSTIERHSIHK